MPKSKTDKSNKPAVVAKPWTMPDWMEKYRSLINNTGGNSVEDLVRDRKTNMLINAPRAMLCVAVKSQVMLLESLHESGHIK